MKYQVLLSQKNNEKLFKTVVCCSRDWRLESSTQKLHHETVTEKTTLPNGIILEKRILLELSFHIKFMKRTFGEFNKFHMKWP